MGNENGHLREFGKFRLDARRRVLWCDNEPVNLPLKEIEILCVLTENGGQVVTKDEIISRVWADSFVEESNLSRHIYLLRKTFKDYGESESLIKTVPRRGYRFAGEVNHDVRDHFVIERHAISQTLIEQIEDSVEPNFRPVDRRPRKLVLAAIAIAAVAIGAFVFTLGSRTTQPINSLAVLPFKTINMSGEDAHQGIGLADVLITRLSNLTQINVRPTSAVYEFENKDIDISEAGRKLGVDAILEGTIYRSDEKVRVTSRLSRLSDQKILWSGDFEKTTRDAMQIQNEIALQVTDALTINFTEFEKDALSKAPTANEDAYQLYVKGRYHWNKRNLEGLSEAQRYFKSAVERDPNFALAYVGLTDTILFTGDPSEATVAYAKAMSIDPNLGEIYASIGFYNTFHQWKWDDAELNFKKSIELKPGYGTAHQWYATLLMIRGRHAEAVAELERALEINPNSYNFLADLGQAYYFARDYESAENYNRRALEIYPDFLFAHQNLEHVYFQTGQYEKAIEEQLIGHLVYSGSTLDHEKFKRDYQNDKQHFLDVLRKGGRKEFWSAYSAYIASAIANTDKNANTHLLRAWIFTKLGEKEKALDALETAVERKAFLAPFVNVDPRFDELRGEPRFQEILKKMSLSN
jgi:DNA-binding winged helix-turn-helix (wHTH) protein/TolB-like protein/Tfp pilus assembly protein PilF